MPSDTPPVPATANPPALKTRRGVHVPALDGIRGLAILMVMLYHFYPQEQAVNPIDRVLSKITYEFGATGVFLFFVLSGHLITGILYDAKTGPHYFRNFYARRALRIFPLYYGFLFVLFCLVPLIHFPSDPNYRYLFDHQQWYWLYANNIYETITGRVPPLIGHFWSLAIEEQFYLVWPLVVLLLSRRSIMRCCAVMFAIAFVSRALVVFAGANPDVAPARFTPCELDALGTGAFLAMLARGSSSLERYRKSAMLTGMLSGGVLVGITISIPYLARHGPLLTASIYALFSIIFGSLLLFTLRSEAGGWNRRIFELPLLRSFGKYSYALYVFHWPLARLVLIPLEDRLVGAYPTLGNYLPILLLGAIVKIGLSFMIAYASWHLYEKHFLKLKRYFGEKAEDQGNAKLEVRS